MKMTKEDKRHRIHKRIRKKINGTAELPRLVVFRSNKEIYCQVVDDLNGHTLLAASSRDKGFTFSGSKVDQAKAVGKAIAEKAKSANVGKVTFDRGGYLYHGRIKALAEGAREGGLQF